MEFRLWKEAVCSVGFCLLFGACSEKATKQSVDAQEVEGSDKESAVQDQKEPRVNEDNGVSSSVHKQDEKDTHAFDPRENLEEVEEGKERVVSQEASVDMPEGYDDIDFNLQNDTLVDDASKDDEYELALLSCKTVSGYFIATFSAHVDSGSYLEAFTAEDSRKILTRFVNDLDPSKIFFTKNDVEGIYERYTDSLKENFLAFECASIAEIYDLWTKRVFEREEVVKASIYDAQHDFTVDEYLERIYKRDFLDEKGIADRIRMIVKSHILLADEEDDNLLKGQVSAQIYAAIEDTFQGYVTQAQEMSRDDVYAQFLSSAYTSLDRMTDFLTPEIGNLHTEGISREIRGKIGTLLGNPTENSVEVQFIFHNSPAQTHGFLQEGDRLTAVKEDLDAEWETYAELGRNSFVSAIRGEEDDSVFLRVERENNGDLEKYEIEIVRDNFITHSNSASYHYFSVPSQFVDDQDLKVGYISMTGFKTAPYEENKMDAEAAVNARRKYQPGTAQLVALAMEDLVNEQGIHSLVIDLRNNSGGYMNEATLMLEKFSGTGAHFYAKSRRTTFPDYPSLMDVLRNIKTSLVILPQRVDPEAINVKNYPRQPYLNIPVVILVNRLSASASELLSQGLKLSHRAIIVGDPSTFGKGTIQTQKMLNNGFVHKVTSGRFYGMNGISINDVGVKSDIVIPTVTGAMTGISQSAQGSYENKLPQVKKLPTHFHQNLDLGFRNRELISLLERQSVERAHKGTILQKAWQWYEKTTQIEEDFSSSMSLSINERRRKKAAEKLESGDFSESLNLEDGGSSDEKSFLDILDEYKGERYLLKTRLEFDPETNVSDVLHRLYETDYVMQEALSIAADYFVLCRAGDRIQEGSIESLKSILEKNQYKQGCESFSLGGAQIGNSGT